MFEAIAVRTNQEDDAWVDSFFEKAFAPKSQALTVISSSSPAPDTKKYIRSPALPTQLANEVEQVFANILGDGEFVYVTIHQDLSNLRRRLRNTTLPAPRLGKRLIDLIDADFPVEVAYEDILKDFFACLERELCCYVRSVRVYENDHKSYTEGAPVTHVHMCVPLPKGRSYYRFAGVLYALYSRLVYPVPLPLDLAERFATPTRTFADLKGEPREIAGTGNLNYLLGRLDGDQNHPEYSIKQIVSEAVLRSRLHTSMKAKDMQGGKF